MSTKKMMVKNMSSNKHILINDAGIGSNRIIITNYYLNNYNYYNKSTIKLSEIRKKKYLERKLQLAAFKKEKAIPGQLYSTPYYSYNNKNNNNKYNTINYESNKNIKKAEINYLDEIYQNKSNENHKVGIKKIKLKRNYKLFDDLISNFNKKRINYKKYKIKTEVNNNSLNDKICCINTSKFHDINRSNTKEDNYKLNEGNMDSKILKHKKENLEYKPLFRKTTSETKNKINSYFDREDKVNNRNKIFNKKENHINKTNDNFNYINKTNLNNKINISFINKIFTNINFFSHKNFKDLKISAERLNSDLINISPYYKRVKHEEVEEKNINENESKNSLFPLI